jgi:L-ascorbate metabolism protein UlaG (beta-lactamase superfamily)
MRGAKACILAALAAAMLALAGCSSETLNLNKNISTTSPAEESESMNILGLNIELLGHASVRIKDKKVIYIDPFQLMEDSSLTKADLVLITHSHYDHCSIKDAEKIVTPNTTIVTVPDCQSKLSNLTIREMKLIAPGQTLQLDNVTISAVPAYNLNKPFHPKANEWVGFIVELDGKRVYHAGDTDVIPEMKNIDVDIALLPVGGTYTMNAAEAAQATRMFKRCKVAVPMHYGSIVGTGSDAEEFKAKAGCEVNILM